MTGLVALGLNAGTGLLALTLLGLLLASVALVPVAGPAAGPAPPVACGIMTRAWVLPILLLVGGLVIAAAQIAAGSPGAAAALLAVFVLLAGLHSPLAFPRSVSAAEAEQRSAADGRPIVYWRAGCKYCLRLRIRLGRDARRLHWVDIWRDPAGAAAVRAATGGDETVPTVVLAGRPYINPDPGWVRGQLPGAT